MPQHTRRNDTCSDAGSGCGVGDEYVTRAAPDRESGHSASLCDAVYGHCAAHTHSVSRSTDLVVADDPSRLRMRPSIPLMVPSRTPAVLRGCCHNAHTRPRHRSGCGTHTPHSGLRPRTQYWTHFNTPLVGKRPQKRAGVASGVPATHPDAARLGGRGAHRPAVISRKVSTAANGAIVGFLAVNTC